MKKFSNKGFTLIELLVVITIISVLAVGGFRGYKSQTQKARDSKRISDITLLASGVEQYEIDNGDLYQGEANPTDAIDNENIQNFRDAHKHYVPNIQNIYDVRPRGNTKCKGVTGGPVECLYMYRHNSHGYKLSTRLESRSSVCNSYQKEECFATEDGGISSMEFEIGTYKNLNTHHDHLGYLNYGLDLYKSN